MLHCSDVIQLNHLHNPILGTKCDNLTNPANGTVWPQENLVFEDTVLWQCDAGFEYCPGCPTSYTAICNATGEWNMTAPPCQSKLLICIS